MGLGGGIHLATSTVRLEIESRLLYQTMALQKDVREENSWIKCFRPHWIPPLLCGETFSPSRPTLDMGFAIYIEIPQVLTEGFVKEAPLEKLTHSISVTGYCLILN